MYQQYMPFGCISVSQHEFFSETLKHFYGLRDFVETNDE